MQDIRAYGIGRWKFTETQWKRNWG